MRFVLILYKDIIQDHFWKKVNKQGVNQCWLWTAYRDRDGYGFFNVNGASRKAHRVSYVIHHGSLDPSLLVCHSCDNPGCVNPAHLWLGTHQDNTDDMVTKQRALHGIRNPKAKLNDADVRCIVRFSKEGLYGTKIAQMLGCNQRTVSNILLGKQWSLVTGIRHA